jgi:replicative DNA helicase
MIVFGARPDSGKTSFVASEVSYIAGALDKPVVWFNNEEDGARVKLRIYSTTLNKTLEEIMEDPVTASEDYIRIMGDKGKIRVIDKGYMDVRGVNNFLKDNEVGLIVFDQLRKIHGFESQTESEVLRLQMLYQWGREIAKEYAPVIAIHQARGDAEGSRYIALNQFEGSQTALQGEADAILTMGRIYEPGYESSRFLWVVKNKLDGLDPTKRNAKTELRFDGARARFYD